MADFQMNRRQALITAGLGAMSLGLPGAVIGNDKVDAKGKMTEVKHHFIDGFNTDPDPAKELTSIDLTKEASKTVLNLFGITALTYMWALQAKAAFAAKKNGGSADPYFDTKITTGKYFLARMTPDAGAHLAKLKSGADPVMSLAADAF